MDDDSVCTNLERCIKESQDEYGNETDTGINGFVNYMATWERHPDRDEDWAEVELGKIGEERFRREHKCEFIAFDETLIDSIKLANMEARDLMQYRQVRWYAPLAKGKLLYDSIRSSLGTGGDNSAIQVYHGMKQMGRVDA